MDTDLIEILSLRERKIECTLLKCYVEEISLNINALVLENCKGCVALESGQLWSNKPLLPHDVR